MPIAPGASQRRTTLLLLALALALLLLHLLANGQYGFHRDELAVLDDARHLAWGYVAYPPLVPFLAHVSMQLFGDSLTAFRAPSALAQALAMLFTGLIARELGGRRAAQLVAAIAVGCGPFAMLAGSMLQYTSPDYLWWVMAAWLLLKLANADDGDPSRGRYWWLALGLVIGLGMMTRYTMLFCAAGIAVAILATPLRRRLASPWPWLGVLVSLLVFAPNAWWQWQHDFIYLDFVQHIHARDVRIGRTGGFLSGQLLVGTSPLLAPLWLAGLAWLAFAGAAKRWRALAWLYLAALLLFRVAGARDYYLAPAYPMLVAAGVVALERGIARLRPRTATLARGAAALVLLAAVATTGLIGLPLAPIGSHGWRISRQFHDNFAEQVGWPELVAQVAAVYRALPPEERARTAIYANNYGEAGAVNRYGPRLGLPTAISGINSYWARGYGNPPPTTVIVLGDDAEGIRDTPATCTLAARVRIPHGVENEESGHPDIYVCRDLRFDWAKAWPKMRSFG
ncbi:glycosyltransferase family 39 protein [Luteimonas sp. 50]|uniref:Glycosyltransferase family 39 protein n=1 Tax=Cognatiluteimonas sedimenti TaxID=2927791 RepID=A0ABT0A3E3_9GAMM|nr:glycosyltransferase family 39 protein [Lysobacter sedimenti]MCJ0825510.1 glycosyltransferase family 39 protein [Lysobacter sedimenti]